LSTRLSGLEYHGLLQGLLHALLSGVVLVKDFTNRPLFHQLFFEACLHLVQSLVHFGELSEALFTSLEVTDDLMCRFFGAGLI
jgi:hypothetical protein